MRRETIRQRRADNRAAGAVGRSWGCLVMASGALFALGTGVSAGIMYAHTLAG